MEIKDLEILSQIYNTLFAINTKGDDTIAMAECLKTLKSFILAKDKELKEKKEG